MKQRPRWKTIRKNLSKLLNISPQIIDFLANYDIILSSISGTSNRDISKNFGIEEKEIRTAILDYVGIFCDNWGGFSESSDINPYFVYKTLVKTLDRVPTEDEYSDELQRLTGDASFLGESPQKIYQIVSVFSTIRYKYLSEYRKEDYGNYISRYSQETP